MANKYGVADNILEYAQNVAEMYIEKALEKITNGEVDIDERERFLYGLPDYIRRSKIKERYLVADVAQERIEAKLRHKKEWDGDDSLNYHEEKYGAYYI